MFPQKSTPRQHELKEPPTPCTYKHLKENRNINQFMLHTLVKIESRREHLNCIIMGPILTKRQTLIF
jgi:hypothetical protein